MFISSLMTKFGSIILSGLLIIVLILVTFIYRYKAQIIEQQNSIDNLSAQVKILDTTVKHNDEIASSTINSLNESLSKCQGQQDDLMIFCEKRIQLALESREQEIEVSQSKQSNSSKEKVVGLDKKSSSKYIDEFNKIIRKFNNVQ